MYLISWDEEEARIEASLGGRITADEMEAFADELLQIVDSMGEEDLMVVLDQSRAKSLDRQGSVALSSCKDALISHGVVKVVTVARDETDMLAQTSDRLQMVLEGREAFVLDDASIVPVQRHQVEIRRAA